MKLTHDSLYVKSYFEDYTAISQSELKSLIYGIENFNANKEKETLYYEEKEHFIIGSGVDVIITQGRAEFDKNFALMMVNKPSDKIMSIVHRILDNTSDNPEIRLLDDVSTQTMMEAIEDEDYQRRLKPETRIKKVITEGGDYFVELKRVGNRQICESDEWTLIHNIANKLNNSNQFRHLMIENEGIEGVDYLYQTKLYFKHQGVACKALPDLIIVDHNKKVIYIIDFKTTGKPIYDFPFNMRKLRYDIQLTWYELGLAGNLDNIAKSIGMKLEDIKDYMIELPKFLVMSTISDENPVLVNVTNDLLNIAMFGREAVNYQGIKFGKIKGINELIKDYSWYIDNGFEHQREFVENEFNVSLDWDDFLFKK